MQFTFKILLKHIDYNNTCVASIDWPLSLNLLIQYVFQTKEKSDIKTYNEHNLFNITERTTLFTSC